MGARVLTVEMWFKPSTISQRAALFSTTDKKMNGFYLGYRGYYMRLSISAQSYLDVPVRFFEETWHHVAGVFDGRGENNGKLTFYLDGKKIGSKTIAETFIPWRAKKKMKAPTIGAWSGDLRYRHFWGKVDNIRISRKALGPADLLMKADEKAIMNPPGGFLVNRKSVQKTLAFGYSGKKGPNSWASLSPNNTLCGSGEQQSPINLPAPVPDKSMSGQGNTALPASHLKYIEMDYHSTPTKQVYNGSVFGLTLGSNAGTLIMNNYRFKATGVRFHTPSEHTIGGMPSEMEMQLDHFDVKTGKRCIVVILFQRGRENLILKKVFKNLHRLSRKKGKMGRYTMVVPKNGAPVGTLDLLDVIPYDPGFVVYNGSMTTPPCTEDVLWVVIDKSITASKKQINTIKKVVGDNARPQSPLNGRPVKRISVGTAMLSNMLLRRLERRQAEFNDMSEVSEL